METDLKRACSVDIYRQLYRVLNVADRDAWCGAVQVSSMSESQPLKIY